MIGITSMRIPRSLGVFWLIAHAACSSSGDGRNDVGLAPDDGGRDVGLAPDDHLFAVSTSTTAEWITDDYYECRNERSACALPCSPLDLWVAINEIDFRESATCGACMQVVGPKGKVTVEVIENCGGACADGEIELSQAAFRAIADLEEGHAEVAWQLVRCQQAGPMSFSYEPDSDDEWAAIQVRNTTLPVASLAIRVPSEQAFRELQRDGWNHFPVSAKLGAGPFDFRVTAIDGQEVTEEGVAYVPGGVVEGQRQFQ
jgi:expansin